MMSMNMQNVGGGLKNISRYTVTRNSHEICIFKRILCPVCIIHKVTTKVLTNTKAIQINIVVALPLTARFILNTRFITRFISGLPWVALFQMLRNPHIVESRETNK